MKSTIEIVINDDGSLEMPYEDGADEIAQAVGGQIVHVERASNVEWEVVENKINARYPPVMRGWTVRSAHNLQLALRVRSSPAMGAGYVDSIECSDHEWLILAVYDTRESALAAERKHFWDLIPRKDK